MYRIDMFHVVPERAHDLSRWGLFVAQEVKVSGVLDEGYEPK